MDGLQTIKAHIEVMLGLITEQLEKSVKRRHQSTADDWDRGYMCGQEDTLKTEKIHLEMALGLIKNELGKSAENPNQPLQSRPGA